MCTQLSTVQTVYVQLFYSWPFYYLITFIMAMHHYLNSESLQKTKGERSVYELRKIQPRRNVTTDQKLPWAEIVILSGAHELLLA